VRRVRAMIRASSFTSRSLSPSKRCSRIVAKTEGSVRRELDPRAAAWWLLSLFASQGFRTATMPDRRRLEAELPTSPCKRSQPTRPSTRNEQANPRNDDAEFRPVGGFAGGCAAPAWPDMNRNLYDIATTDGRPAPGPVAEDGPPRPAVVSVVLRQQADLRWLETCARYWNAGKEQS
jgi:hypothetical protein